MSSGASSSSEENNVVYTVVPHDPIVLSSIRTNDVWLLLCIGAVWELTIRTFWLLSKRKSSKLLKKEVSVELLQRQTDTMRKKGQPYFVETSKLERKLLVAEKELSNLYSQRKKFSDAVEKYVVKYGRHTLALLVFLVYYGVPIVTLEHVEIGPIDFVSSATYMKTLLFPISLVGFGVRMSKWGMTSVGGYSQDVAASSIGGLLVVWSAQVTVGMIMDAVDAYVLCG